MQCYFTLFVQEINIRRLLLLYSLATNILLILFEKLKIKMNADPTIFSQIILSNLSIFLFSKLGAK